MDELEEVMKRSHNDVAAAMREVAAAKKVFNRIINRAVKAGWSTGKIAETLGVTRSRAWEMVRQADGRGRSTR